MSKLKNKIIIFLFMYSISTTAIVYQNYIFIAILFKKYRAFEWLCKRENEDDGDNFFLCYDQENYIQFLLTTGLIIQFASGSVGSMLIKIFSKKYIAKMGFFFIFIGWVLLCLSLYYSKYFVEHKIENNFQTISLLFNIVFICFGIGSDNSYLPIIYYINERYPVKDDVIKSNKLKDKFNKLKNLLRNKNYILISTMSSLAVLSLFVGNVMNITLNMFDFENNIIIIILIYISLCVIPSFFITNFLDYKESAHEEHTESIIYKHDYEEKKKHNILNNVHFSKENIETICRIKKNYEENSYNSHKNNFDRGYEENADFNFQNNTYTNYEEDTDNKFSFKDNKPALTNENIPRTNNDIVIYMNTFQNEQKNNEVYNNKNKQKNKKNSNSNSCILNEHTINLDSKKENIFLKNMDLDLLKKQVTSSFYLFIIIEFFIVTFSMCFFMFSLFDIYDKNTFGNTLNIYALFLPSSFIVTLIFGIFADIIGIHNFISFNLILGISQYLFVLIYYNTHNITIGYLSLIIYFFHQSFFASHMYMYMSTIFRDNNFSMLIGIINFFACFALYLSYKIYESIIYQRENTYSKITTEVIISLYIIIFLFYIIYTRRKIYHELINI